MFKKDDYIVLLNSEYLKHGQPYFIPNHCYKMRSDNYFSPYLDSNGNIGNGWGIVSYDNPDGISCNGLSRIAWRYATEKEIKKYEFLKRPFNTYNRKSIINKILA